MPDQPVVPANVPQDDRKAVDDMRRLTRRSFAVGGLAGLGGLATWAYVAYSSHLEGLPWPLRRILELNERIGRATFSPGRLAPEFPPERAEQPRTNGWHGVTDGFDPATWMLEVSDDSGKKRRVGIDEIRALPRTSEVTELKCIEGWSVVVQWAGVALRDFAKHFGLATNHPYVGLETPDGAYYVSIDRDSALHPQTLLCYEMNGDPLPLNHGAPLRLVLPIKYGIKNIKRIGRLWFTDTRPRDYWLEQGYDWYAGL